MLYGAYSATQRIQVVIANTKGFTGHAMGTGIEDVVAVKALETGCVPPVANFKEVDPELGTLNLSKGGAYPVEYALRLGCRFRVANQHDPAALDTNERWCPSSPECLGLRVSHCGRQNCWKAWLSQIAGYPSCEPGSSASHAAGSWHQKDQQHAVHGESHRKPNRRLPPSISRRSLLQWSPPSTAAFTQGRLLRRRPRPSRSW